MESALHVIKLSKHTDFEVQTSLFSSHMSTRIFADNDHIPTFIIEKVKEVENSTDLIDKIFISTDNLWDDYNSVYSNTEFSGVGIETFSFQDAGYVHEAVSKIVEEFLNTHKRIVHYV